jgi:hypothetical protein
LRADFAVSVPATRRQRRNDVAAVLVGLVLFRNGKHLGAGIAVAAVACALAVEHVWLLN